MGLLIHCSFLTKYDGGKEFKEESVVGQRGEQGMERKLFLRDKSKTE
jgi:hypothetical protein